VRIVAVAATAHTAVAIYCAGCVEIAARELDLNSAGLSYLDWFYNTNVWKDLHYRGVRTLKLPLDMWNYQEIIFQNKLHWVIETGTRHGGSALFFADLLTAGKRDGAVITIDVTHEALDPAVAGHPAIRFLLGDSASEQMVAQAMSWVPFDRQRGLLLILDADHAAAHVFRELTA
jgi:cephalosporin hydroxylase